MRALFAISSILLIFLSILSSAGGDYIIIRCNVNPLYIENEPVLIQAFVIVFRNGRPTDESAVLHVEIKGLNVNYSYAEEFKIHGGKRETYSLPGLAEGHYRITIFAEKAGIVSQKMAFEIGVTKPPVPYSAYFTKDGRQFYFKSLKLNETGEIDPEYPFTIKIYSWKPPNDAVLIRTIANVTEIKVDIPSSIRRAGGIVIVDVIDKWGWKNSASMDLASFSFTGIPLMYDYGYKYREPFKSMNVFYIIAGIAIIAAMIFIFRRLGG